MREIFLHDLEASLEAARIPLEMWGSAPGTKPISELIKQLKSTEAHLYEDDGLFFRYIRRAVVHAWYRMPDGTTKRLYEAIKKLEGERATLLVPLKLPGEKLRDDEPPIEGAYRVLTDEIGINASLKFENLGRSALEPRPDRSFPGLWSRGEAFNFETFFPDVFYREGGYMEFQRRKELSYLWLQEPYPP